MKVILQEWDTKQGYQVSLSKDQEQLTMTIARLKETNAGTPKNESIEIELPDDNVLAKMVKSKTVFINPDDREAIPRLH